MRLAAGLTALLTAPLLAQNPPAWVAKSNQNAQLVIDIGARYSPEGAAARMSCSVLATSRAEYALV